MWADTGESLALDIQRWHEPSTAEEHALLATIRGPVLDVGCGPGRLVVSLADRGISALGIDSSPAAVALARARGAAVIERDLFGPLPGEGGWATVLLFDGNVGIGGDPIRLLSRCRQLTGSAGCVLAEVEPPTAGCRRLTAWLERDGRRSPHFAWAVVGADAIGELAAAAGFELRNLRETASGRWFAHLGIPPE